MTNVFPIHGRKRGKGFAVGQLFVGRYRLLRRLGRGGMGEVWTATDERIERVVALKLLHPSLLEVEGSRGRFERESRALSLAEHEHVVPLYDWGTEPQPFIVMKRVEGITLREMLRERGRVPWVAAVCFAIQTAEGLAGMHRMKMWHRDVKPENIMVDEDGHVSIIDLGIARDAGRPRRGEETDRMGTVGYMPPEMCREEPVDHRGDLYQLGLVLYELIAGHKPYGGVDEANETDMQSAHVHDPPDPLGPECPEALAAVLLRLLAKDPSERYQSAREVSAVLGQVLRDWGSVPAGHAMEALVGRAMVRRKLNSMAAEARAAEAQEAQEAPPARREHTEPMGQRTTLELVTGFVPQSPASPSARAPAQEGEPMDEGRRQRTTLELVAGFVPQSPASPSARAPAPAPVADTQPPKGSRRAPRSGEGERWTMSLPPGYVPSVRAPFPLAAGAKAASARKRAARPRRAFRRGARAGIALLWVSVLILSLRALSVPAPAASATVGVPAPAASATEASAAPVVFARAAPLPSSAPASDATASAAVAAPARRAAPAVRQTPKPKRRELIFQ